MMKRARVLPIFFLVAAAVVFAPGTVQSKAKAGNDASNPVFLHPGDLRWTDLDPKGAPGIQIADVWGDHANGAYSAFLKFPAGFLSPLHTHTYVIKILVVSGTYTQAPEGKPTQRMGPGSYVFQPNGSYKHISGCDKASDCVLFIESDGPFDLKPVAAGTI